MPELDDLRLNEPAEPAPAIQDAPSGPGLLVPAIIVAAIIGIGLAVLLWPRHPAEPPAKPAAAAEPQSYPVSSPQASQAVQGDNIPLPPLDETDSLVRQLVSQLSSHPRVAAWLATDGLLRNFAVVVTNIADGGTPVKTLRAQRPQDPFTVRTTPAGTVIDPASFHRYDAYADAVAGLDARNTARVYETLKPRIAEAYKQLGNPEADIDAAFKRALTLLINTPQVNGDIAVTRTSVNWKFADPQIEALPQAQKQLIRMGPRNQQIIQAKLREIAPYLGF